MRLAALLTFFLIHRRQEEEKENSRNNLHETVVNLLQRIQPVYEAKETTINDENTYKMIRAHNHAFSTTSASAVDSYDSFLSIHNTTTRYNNSLLAKTETTSEVNERQC